MKNVDIRVIGKTEIDMNTLTGKAYGEVDKLFVEYGQLKDYKDYIWLHSELRVTDDGYWYHTNDDELRKVHNELDMIEYKILDIIKDYNSYKFHWKKMFKWVGHKNFYLSFATLFFGFFAYDLFNDNITGAICDAIIALVNFYWFTGEVEKEERV